MELNYGNILDIIIESESLESPDWIWKARVGGDFYPGHWVCGWTRWRDCYNGNIRLAGPELSNAWCVHLWGEMARREPDAWENMSRNSMAG